MGLISDFVYSTITYWGWEQAKEQAKEQAGVQASGLAGGQASDQVGDQVSDQVRDQVIVQATQVQRLVKVMWNKAERRCTGYIPSWAQI